MCLQNWPILKARFVFKLIHVASWSRHKCLCSCNFFSEETVASGSFFLSFKGRAEQRKEADREYRKRDNSLFQSIMLTNLYCSGTPQNKMEAKHMQRWLKIDPQESFTLFVLLYKWNAPESYGVMQLLCTALLRKPGYKDKKAALWDLPAVEQGFQIP